MKQSSIQRGADAAWELAALIFCMVAGATIGACLPLPLKGEGVIATVVVFAVGGAVVWLRRHHPFATTAAICAALLVIGWPLSVMVLDVLHRYY